MKKDLKKSKLIKKQYKLEISNLKKTPDIKFKKMEIYHKYDKKIQNSRSYKNLNKVPAIVKNYSINFLLSSIFFNLFLASIISLIVYSINGTLKWDKFSTSWSIWFSLFFGINWLIQSSIKHFNWYRMTRAERAVFIALRRFGKNAVIVSNKEIDRRFGQKDLLEIIKDTDKSEEMGMLINGLATFINIYIGIKILLHIKKYNISKQKFKFIIQEDK
ncbi:MAG: hypothetical protein K4H23_04510 [Mollicutes bacterium PWAP]|nr:hypothetical protein [Mollicutes bacterium PWAP]